MTPTFPLVASTDWTVIGTAAVTASATIVMAILGYLGGTRLELTKTREERSAANRQARAQVYVDFLNAERGLESMTASNQLITKDAFEDWATRYTERYNGALLFGAETVRERTGSFHPTDRAEFERLRDLENPDEDDFNCQVREGERQSRAVRRKDRQLLIDAMREDIGLASSRRWPSGRAQS
jgi:hypothetical protein